MKYLFALIALAIATPASAELIFFSETRSMSVASHRVEGDRIIVSCAAAERWHSTASLITKIAPDEVPYPEDADSAETKRRRARADRRQPGARRQDGLRSDHRNAPRRKHDVTRGS